MMDSAKKKYGVFISYSHEDVKFVSPIVKLISAMRKDLVFQDTEDIKAGMKWEPQLQNALENAEIVIIFWCEHSAKSTYVQSEYEKAIHANKDILPVLLDDCKLNEELSAYQWIDLHSVISHDEEINSPNFLKYKKSKSLLILSFILVVIITALFSLLSIFNISTMKKLEKSDTTYTVTKDTSKISPEDTIKLVSADTSSLNKTNSDSQILENRLKIIKYNRPKATTYRNNKILFRKKNKNKRNAANEQISIDSLPILIIKPSLQKLEDSIRIVQDNVLRKRNENLEKTYSQKIKNTMPANEQQEETTKFERKTLILIIALSVAGFFAFWFRWVHRKSNKNHKNLHHNTVASEIINKLNEKLPPI